MQVNDLSGLVIKRFRRAWSAYTKQNAFEKMPSRYSWAFIIKHDGSTRYTTADGRCYISDNSHIIVAPCGSEYTWQCDVGGWVSLIEFDAEIEGLTEEDYKDILCIKTNAFSRLLSIEKEMEMSHMGDASLMQPTQMKCMYEFVTVLLRNDEKQIPLDNSNFQKIRPALEYMSRFYRSEKLTNDVLSAKCGISTVYFRKLFTQAYGVSPQTCIFRLRMESARELLKNGDCENISEVASRVGYDDVYQFSKMFKKYVGVSPKGYAKRLKNGSDVLNGGGSKNV